MMTHKPIDGYIRVSRRLGRKGPGYPLRGGRLGSRGD
jgi:hypothetical protein